MFNKLALAAALALPLGLFGLSGAAFAGYSSGATMHKVPMARHMMHRGAMSCAAAERRIRADGFRHVRARDCDDRTYVFHATRHGRPVLLHFNPRTGHIKRVVRA